MISILVLVITECDTASLFLVIIASATGMTAGVSGPVSNRHS